MIRKNKTNQDLMEELADLENKEDMINKNLKESGSKIRIECLHKTPKGYGWHYNRSRLNKDDIALINKIIKKCLK